MHPSGHNCRSDGGYPLREGTAGGDSSAPAPRFSPGAQTEMRASMAVFRREIETLVRGVTSGVYNDNTGRAAGERILNRSFEGAYRQGLASLGVTSFTDFDRTFVANSVANEMRFLNQLVRDVATGQGSIPYGIRAGYYGRGYESLYLVGQLQALPWETDIYWKLSATDHCKDCVSLADASPFSKATIPVVPGSGGTQCLFNCGCYLEYRLRQPQRPELVSREGRLDAIAASAGDVPEGRRLPTAEELDVIRGMWGKVQQYRTAVRFAPTELKGVYVAARRDANEALISYLDDNGIYWTRGMEDDLFNPPPGGGVGGGFPRTGADGIESDGPIIMYAGIPPLGPELATASLGDLGEPEPDEEDE